MALSNSERQARWRAKLKAQAALGNARLLDVFREHMRTLLLRDANFSDEFSEEERRLWTDAAESLIAQKDSEIMEVLNALIDAWHKDECVSMSRKVAARNAGAKGKR
jgi:hypothetical protein